MFYGNKFLNLKSANDSLLLIETDFCNISNIINEIYDLNADLNYRVVTEGAIKDFLNKAAEKIKEIVAKILESIKKAVEFINKKLIGFIDKILIALRKKKSEMNGTTPTVKSEAAEEELTITYYKLSQTFHNEIHKFENHFSDNSVGGKFDDFIENTFDEINPSMNQDQIVEFMQRRSEEFNNLLSKESENLSNSMEIISSEEAFQVIEIKMAEYNRDTLDKCIRYIEDIKRDTVELKKQLKDLHYYAMECQEDFDEMQEEIEKALKDYEDPSSEVYKDADDIEKAACKVLIPTVRNMMPKMTTYISKLLSCVAKAEGACGTVLSRNAMSANKIKTLISANDIERLSIEDIKPDQN